MSQDPIGRLLKVTSIGGSQKVKLNHVPNTVINPLQLTGQKMKTIIEQNPQGSIPVPSRVRSVTIDVVGKPKTVFKEDNIDLSRAKRSVERHLSKPFGYSERILSKSKNQRDSSQNKSLSTQYQHPDIWNKSINTESKRQKLNFTKEQTLQTLKSMNKSQRNEFIFKSHNQAKIIEKFYKTLRKILKQRGYINQYGQDIEQDAEREDQELLNNLFNNYTHLRNINIGQRTDQKFSNVCQLQQIYQYIQFLLTFIYNKIVYLDELKDFCFTIGFSSNEQGEQQITQFYEQIYNPELLQDAKIISKKPSLHSLRTLTIIEQLIHGQAFVKKVDMVSMKAIIYNYGKFLHENYDIHEKFSRNAAKQLLVDLLTNINPWVVNKQIHFTIKSQYQKLFQLKYKKKLLKFSLEKSDVLEEQFFTLENVCGNQHILKKIIKKIKERNEQIQEKLILTKFIHQMVRNQFLQIDNLKDSFVKQIVSKAEKITYLEDFMAGLLNYIQVSELIGEEVQQIDENNDGQSEDNLDGQEQEQQRNRQLPLERIADFIHSNKYRGEQHDIIINFLLKIKKQVNERNQSENNQFIMYDDVTVFCTQYKARQDFKQNVIKQYIQKAKQFYDKHIGDAVINNEENKKKFDTNTIGTYTLKKMRKYDTIIGNRAYKVNEILNIVQKRTIFGIESPHYNGPLNENDLFEQIEAILNSENKDFNINILFSDNFTHEYFLDYLEIQEKEKLKCRAWDDEIKQALQLYQRESQRLLNVVQTWKPQDKKNCKQGESPSFSKSNRNKRNASEKNQYQGSKATPQQLNRQFMQNFIEDEEKEFKKQNESQRSSRYQDSARGQQTKNQVENKIDQGLKIKKQNPTTSSVQQNIKDQIKINSNQSDKRNSISTPNKKLQENKMHQQQQQVQKNTSRNSIEQMKNIGKIQNTQENENLSFFEYIDNQYGFNDDKNSSFQSKQGQQQKVQNNKAIIPPLPIQSKVNNSYSIKDPSPVHSSHNDLSTLNKTNQDSIANDPQIQKTNQMYADLFNILNSIKDEYDIV